LVDSRFRFRKLRQKEDRTKNPHIKLDGSHGNRQQRFTETVLFQEWWNNKLAANDTALKEK